jgi:hypothetical protein
MADLPYLRAAIAESTRFIQATWQQVVMGALPLPGIPEIKANIGLRQLYAENILLGDQTVVSDAGYLRRYVIATKQIANDLEYGKGPWDMKPMLLGGPKARISKKGNRYNIIPMRHGTSSKSGQNAYFKPMPKDVLGKVRMIKPSFAAMVPQRVRVGGKMQTSMQPKGLKWGGRLTGTEAAHPPGQNPTTGYQHKAGKYEGMTRIRKRYDNATQSKYLTFRIVSDKSDPGSWWHPGYQAHGIAQHVSDYCKPAIEGIIRQAANADLIPPSGLSIGMRISVREE